MTMRIKGPRLGFVALVAAGIIVGFPSAPANADFVIDTSVTALAQGFGAVPRLLTAQGAQSPPAAAESACDANSGGSLVTGPTACAGADATFQGNGYFTTDTANPGDVTGPKNSLANLSSLGITDASQILINYNPSQQGADPSTRIQDFTLKFYNASNNLVISVDGGCGFVVACYGTAKDLFFGDAGTNLGNGGVGFILALDATEAAAVNAACGANLAGCVTAAGEGVIDNSNDGPDSFTL